MDAASPEEWFRRLPKFTKIFSVATFAVTVLVVLKLLDPTAFILDWQLVRQKFHIWRLFTDYFFIGNFSFSWIFQMYFFVQFSSKLEVDSIFRGSPGQFLYFLLIEIMVLNVISLILYWPSGRPIMGPSLHFAIIYYWSRREPEGKVGIWGFTIEAYQLPFALLFLDVIMGQSIWSDVLGLFAGHMYYFLREVLPSERSIRLVNDCPKVLDDLALKIDKISGGSATATTNRIAARQDLTSSSTTNQEGTSMWNRLMPSRNTEFSGSGHRLGTRDDQGTSQN